MASDIALLVMRLTAATLYVILACAGMICLIPALMMIVMTSNSHTSAYTLSNPSPHKHAPSVESARAKKNLLAFGYEKKLLVRPQYNKYRLRTSLGRIKTGFGD